MKQGCFDLLYRATLLLLLLCPFTVYSAVTSGSDFLKIPKSARAIGLGESYTAVVDDPTAIEYNPAALNTIHNVAASMMYQSWIDNSYGMNLAGGYRIGDIVVGASIYWFNYGGLTEYDYFGLQTAEYNPNDLNIKAAVSVDAGILFDILRGLSVGASLGLIDRNMVDQSFWGFNLDLGVNYKTTIGRVLNIGDPYLMEMFGKLPVNAGFAVQNIGFAADTIAPVKFSAGLSFGLLPDLLVSMDLSKDVYNTPWMFKMGAEYTFLEIVSLRAGLNFGRDTGNFSMGAGIRYPMLFNTLRFDYAFTPLGILGNNHNFSLYGEFRFDVRSEDYYQKGAYYFSKKDYLKTREMWRKACQMNPENKMMSEKLSIIEEIVRVYELDNSTTEVTNKVVRLNQLMQIDTENMEPGIIISNKMVTFVYRSISRLIRTVAVTGDFNDWNKTGIPMKQDTNEWTVTIEVQPGVHQYKYIIDGSYFIQDPANSQSTPDGQGGRNSVFTIAGERETNANVRNRKTATNQAVLPEVTNETVPQTNTLLPQENQQKQKVIYTNLNLKEAVSPNAVTNRVNTVPTVTNKIEPVKKITQPKVTYVTNKVAAKNKLKPTKKTKSQPVKKKNVPSK